MVASSRRSDWLEPSYVHVILFVILHRTVFSVMLFRRTVAAKGSVASLSCLTSSLGRSSLVSRGQQMFALRTRSPATQTQQHSGSRYHRESLPHGLRSILVDQRRMSQRRVRQIDDQKRCYILYSTSVGDKLVAFRRRVCDIISRIWFQFL